MSNPDKPHILTYFPDHTAASYLPRARAAKPRPVRHRGQVTLGRLIRVCPCQRKGWFESNYGPVRKPLLQP